MITITDEELEAIIADVKGQLDNGLAAQAAKLSKADDDDTVGQESSPTDAPPDSAPTDMPPPGASASPDASPAASAPASPAPASPDASAAGAAPQAIEPAPTAEGLAQEYAGLAPEEFQMHVQAMQMAATQMGMDLSAMMAPVAPAAPPAAASPAPAMPPASAPAADPLAAAASAAPAASPAMPPAASPDPLAALKSEKEAEVADLKKNQAALEAQFSALTETMKKYFNQPLSKAVTHASDVGFVTKPGSAPEAKPEKVLAPAEVLVGLRKAARNPDLKKSDRDLIDRYVEKKATYEQIKHLLG